MMDTGGRVDTVAHSEPGGANAAGCGATAPCDPALTLVLLYYLLSRSGTPTSMMSPTASSSSSV